MVVRSSRLCSFSIIGVKYVFASRNHYSINAEESGHRVEVSVFATYVPLRTSLRLRALVFCFLSCSLQSACECASRVCPEIWPTLLGLP